MKNGGLGKGVIITYKSNSPITLYRKEEIVMARKRGLWQVVLCNTMVAFLLLGPFTTMAVRAGALSMGEVIATGNAFLTLDSGQVVRIDRYPMPVLGKANIRTGDGIAVVTLTPEGVLEVQKGTGILLYRDGERTVMKIEKGMVRFSVPSTKNLSIVTPSGNVEVGGISRVALKTPSSVPDKGGLTGIVGIEDEKTFISSLKGTLRFATEGMTGIVREGETIILAQAEVGAPAVLKGITASQLQALAAQPGVNVMVGVAEVPALGAGQVAVAIPSGLGGGFVVGTPAAISSGLSAIGIATTAAAVSAAAVATGAAIGVGTVAAIGAGVVAVGAAVAVAAQEEAPASP